MIGGLRAVRALAVGLGPALALAGLVALAGCGPVVDQGVSIVTGTKALRAGPEGQTTCNFAGMSGELAADPADPALVWLNAGGDRVDLTWPHGYRVRFAPAAEVLAPDGTVVTREGQSVKLGGGEAGHTFEICILDGVNLLEPEP